MSFSKISVCISDGGYICGSGNKQMHSDYFWVDKINLMQILTTFSK